MTAKRLLSAIRQLKDFISGNAAGMPVVVWTPDGKGGMERHVVRSPNEMYALQKERAGNFAVQSEERMMDAAVATKGSMDILGPNGHTEVTWHQGNDEEVAAARATFEAMTSRGYQAFRPGPQKGERGGRITTFDPSVERMLLFPALQGG